MLSYNTPTDCAEFLSTEQTTSGERSDSTLVPFQNKFLQLTWELKLHSTEVEVAGMGSKIKALEVEVSSLRDQHSDMEKQVQKLVKQETSLKE